MKWYSVKAINKCGNVEMSHFARYGPDCWYAFNEHLAAVVKSMKKQNPGCKIVVEKGLPS